MSQRNRPHSYLKKIGNGTHLESALDPDDHQDDESGDYGSEWSVISSGEMVYHLILEGLDVSYRIDSNGNVIVDKVSINNHLEQ